MVGNRADSRATNVAKEASTPLEDYALIGDCETAALISRAGSIDWLRWPRFDSGACFAALLGTPEGVGGARSRDPLRRRSGFSRPIEQWRALRRAIHQEVCTRGFDNRAGS